RGADPVYPSTASAGLAAKGPAQRQQMILGRWNHLNRYMPPKGHPPKVGTRCYRDHCMHAPASGRRSRTTATHILPTDVLMAMWRLGKRRIGYVWRRVAGHVATATRAPAALDKARQLYRGVLSRNFRIRNAQAAARCSPTPSANAVHPRDAGAIP